ncbi:MAG: phenylalanine--tRNA ligase subunit alpha [Candidatus Marinimicrobia bacterium]|nr:phenylalanine--tRNA ligase subunit alpha [Candidatus Neomarinimicrobiota bacterium]|tara:strand:- start:2650 stop:3669 length:1020 start_codon:yes stop_codon:yes gene_type:complete
MSIVDRALNVKEQFLQELKELPYDTHSIKLFKDKYLGRKGLIADLFSSLKDETPQNRPNSGKVLNELRQFATREFEAKTVYIDNQNSKKNIGDHSLPEDPYLIGGIHPLTHTLNEINFIFTKLGFSTVYGPEVDTDFFNFEALNIPKHHPARDMQDTFYVKNGIVLRTHTSNTQIHTMLKNKPPIKIIAPGRVFRNEDISVRSYCLFHQVEGLYVDNNVSFSDLKGVLNYFAREMFGQSVKTRFRPSFFPFTEPSAEMDVSCIFCNQKGCNICKYEGWLEILGCGMVDPEVYKSVEYDYDKWSGYAFGMGIERIAMLKYGVKDIRLFYEGDVRFLGQFI